VLICAAACCNAVENSVLQYVAEWYSAIENNTLQHVATDCNALQHTATHCNTLQHTATHCNTLQHTASRRTTLQHSIIGLFAYSSHAETETFTFSMIKFIIFVFHIGVIFFLGYLFPPNIYRGPPFFCCEP